MPSSEANRGACSLVFGVSGVGKTRACEEYARRHPEYLLARASRLLAGVTKLSSETLRTASAEEIIHNQNLLVRAFHDFRAGRQDQPILLEAHATIYNDDQLIDVPVDIIGTLAPNRLILLEAPASEVLARRLSDDRARPIRSIEEIEEELMGERKAVTHYGSILDIPVSIARVGENFSLDIVIP